MINEHIGVPEITSSQEAPPQIARSQGTRESSQEAPPQIARSQGTREREKPPIIIYTDWSACDMIENLQL
ncbi:MAG: hypothetical protein GDA56_33395 [Hormoscilla sp. GM7CHS1pb]|nr:hypothetical protein [Hormoscilla sp. GM7CHS1pb]